MSAEETERFIERVASRSAEKSSELGARRALESIGLATPDARTNIRELIGLFHDYKSAKEATKGWLWGVLKDIARIASKLAAVIALIWLMLKFGVDPEKVEQLTKVMK